MKNQKHKLLASALSLGLLAVSVFLTPVSSLLAATTTPGTINYQGRLLNSANTPLTGAYTFRFSLWSDADWDAGDETGAGAIDVGAVGYAGWQETHAITVGTFGLFDIALGSGTAFPSFTAGTHDYLQVEVKTTGSPDTSYEVLDPTASLADATDRKTIHNEAYAQNADTIDNADVGTAAGNLATLGAGGVWDIARIPGGTNADSFVIDDDDSAASKVLQFGSDGSDGTITYDNTTGDFTIATPADSDLINIDNGTLTGTADGGLDFGSGDVFRIREANDPNTNAACTYLRELIMNTANNMLMRCTGTGAAGVATWTNVDTTGGSVDFEGLFSNDADDTLTTSNSDFTVNTGTADFIITSNDWGVDASGNITTNGTVDGVDLSAIPFGNLATRTKELVLTPEFPYYTVEPDGTSNRGKLTSDFVDAGGAAKYNFYEWNTRQGALQDMDVVVSIQLPLDFVSFTGAPLSLRYNTSNGVTTTNELDVELFDTTGTAVVLTGGSNLASATWATAAITFGGGETFTAGDTITLKVKMATTSSGFARLSDVVLNYNGR